METENPSKLELIPQTIETTDLYQGSYLLAKGFRMSNTKLTRDGKKVLVCFSFTGIGIRSEHLAFCNGNATVNVSDFRRSYLHLHFVLESAKKYVRLEDKKKKDLAKQSSSENPLMGSEENND